MLSLPKQSAAGVVVLLITLLQTLTVQGASVRHHRLRGGDQGGFLAPSSDMIKALEYIESLKQRADGPESPTGDYDEVDKFRFLVQLASQQDENTPTNEEAARWPDNKVPQWVRSLLQVLEQTGETPESQPAPGNERRPHKSRRPVGDAESPVRDYGGFVKPHKKYPLMFEDEENRRGNKRATEDLDEQYTPQSLANMRSIFEELGKMSAAQNQKRENQEEEYAEDDNDLYKVRSLAYEDVTGGEEWVPVEEQLETEEVVKGSREEYERGLGDNGEQGEVIERQASPTEDDDENPDDDTKLVDYYLLKVLEMTNQAQKRDLMEGRRRLLSQPSLIDSRAIKQLLSAISMKLQVPPEDLVRMLFMGETRKQQRLPETQLARKPSQPRYQSRVIKYYNGRQPEVTVSNIPHDVKTEDLLKVLGLGNLANENAKYSLLKQRPYKTMAKYFNPSGRRGSLFLSELNKAPSKRKDDYDDDAVDEDEESTFLAAKLLTEYPDTSSSNRKRAIDSTTNGQFPYEFEEVMKDFFGQVDNGKSTPTKRDTHGKEEPEAPQKPPTEEAQETADQTPPVPGTEEAKEYHGKMVAGMWRPRACIFSSCSYSDKSHPLTFYLFDLVAMATWTTSELSKLQTGCKKAPTSQSWHRRDLSGYERGKNIAYSWDMPISPQNVI